MVGRGLTSPLARPGTRLDPGRDRQGDSAGARPATLSNVNISMKKLIVFDLDGTLAESKSPIDTEMSVLLGDLLNIVKVAVISGGNWPQFEKQVLSNLPHDERLKNLSILPACGTKFFRYDQAWQELYSEDFSGDEKAKIIESLKKAAGSAGFEPEKVWGSQIEDRGSQVTFSALGQQAPIAAKKKWDPDYSKRNKLKSILDPLIPEFSVHLGGTTSIDVTKPGIDKAYGIRKLRDVLGIAIEEMIFLGDALFPGGNDYPAKEAGVCSIRVRDPHETKRVIESIIACSGSVKTRVEWRQESREVLMQVLAVDVGGSHVKILATGQETPRKFVSGPTMTAAEMVSGVRQAAEGWNFEAVSIGYPGPVLRGKPVSEPHNLAPGWVGFDFAAAFGCPVKLINDAAMQALGSYQGGKMLFLGLGTGLGSAMVVDGIVEPMELSHLPYKKGTYEDYVGNRRLLRAGKKKWRRHVEDVVARLVAALLPDDVVLGGGNVRELEELPPGCRAGDNANAFLGAFRMWEEAGQPKPSAP
jgi:HAD superfamily hydrolase (TIGR01484 family)